MLCPGVIASDNLSGVETLDEDRSTVVSALRDAVRRSGLTQGAFACAIGTSAPRLSSYLTGGVVPSAVVYLRILRVANALAGAAAAGWLSAPATAAAAAAATAAGDEGWAFVVVLQGRDHLRELLPTQPELVSAWEAAPRSTQSARWDVLLAAVTAHEFDAAGRRAPRWTRKPSLVEPWVLPSPRLSTGEVRARTPAWLAEKGVYVTERDLVTL